MWHLPVPSTARCSPLTPVLIALVLTALGTLACGQNQPIGTRSEPAVVPALTAEEIEQAVSFREQVGLRSDEAWIRFVAAQPEHDTTYEVPLTDSEAQDLRARVRVARDVALAIKSYGESHPDAWASVYIDQRLGGIVVGQFTKDISAHEAAIRKLVAPEARWQLRSVKYTIAELDDARESIAAEEDWVERQGFDIKSFGIDERANRVLLVVETPAAMNPKDIAGHFGNDPRIRIDSRPLLEWTGGYGTLTIVSTTLLGKGVEDLGIDLSFDQWTGWDRDPGVGTGMNGVTRLTDFPATTVRVRLMRWTSNGRVVAGEGTTTVLPNRETVLRIMVDADY